MREDAVFKPSIEIGKYVISEVPSLLYVVRGRSVRVSYIKEINQYMIVYRNIVRNVNTGVPELQEIKHLLSGESAYALANMFLQFFSMLNDFGKYDNFVKHVKALMNFAEIGYDNSTILKIRTVKVKKS